jgi:hypothetical protein
MVSELSPLLLKEANVRAWLPEPSVISPLPFTLRVPAVESNAVVDPVTSVPPVDRVIEPDDARALVAPRTTAPPEMVKPVEYELELFARIRDPLPIFWTAVPVVAVVRVAVTPDAVINDPVVPEMFRGEAEVP